jgi:hypothetical protein
MSMAVSAMAVQAKSIIRERNRAKNFFMVLHPFLSLVVISKPVSRPEDEFRR